MVGGLLVVGTSVVDSHTSPCLCVDVLSSSTLSSGDSILHRKSSIINTQNHFPLATSFVGSRLPVKALYSKKNKQSKGRGRGLMIVNELAGQYEDSFGDVKTGVDMCFLGSIRISGFARSVQTDEQVINLFTYKAVRTVMNQLYEMNPTQYRWFYDFVTVNKPSDGKHFLRLLAKEKQELAERVMVTRLHLYAKWIKKCDHAEMYKEISDQNLELMRERLLATVIWPSDDTTTETIG